MRGLATRLSYQPTTCITSKEDGVVLFDPSLDVETIPFLIKYINNVDKVLSQAADIIRNTLLHVRLSCQPLPNALTSKHFSEGQASILVNVLKFMLAVVSSQPLPPLDMEQRIPTIIAADLFYNVTKGLIKPAKHICLDVGMKSMTGNEKVWDILHK